MKILIFLLMIISLNGCSIFGHISDETDKKIAFLQSIVDNPEDVDSIITHSQYYDVSIWSTNLNDIRLGIHKYKSSKISLYLDYKTQTWYHQETKPTIAHKIGVLFNDSDMGLFAGFRLIDNKWYISTIYYINKEQMDNFEEPRDMIPTITN